MFSKPFGGAALDWPAPAAMEFVADSRADSGKPLPSCRSPCPWYLRDSPPRRHGAAVCSFGAPRHCGALRGGSPDGFEKCGSTGNLSVHGSLRLRWGGCCCCHPLSCRGRLYGAGAAAVHRAGVSCRRTKAHRAPAALQALLRWQSSVHGKNQCARSSTGNTALPDAREASEFSPRPRAHTPQAC